jgi:HlyD family secretion protein
VKVEVVEEPKEVIKLVKHHGFVEPKQTVPVIPKVPGRVSSVTFEVGDKVSKGDLLLTIEDGEIAAQVRQAEAAVALAEATLEKVRAGARPQERAQVESLVNQAKSNYEAIKLSYDRSKVLYEERVLAQQDFDRIKAQYEVAEAQLRSAEEQLNMVIEGAKEEDIRAVEAQVAQARATLDLARLRHADCKVYAPISGVIAQRGIDAGAMVGGTSLTCVIVDTDPVRIGLGLTEEDVVMVTQDMPVTVTVDSLSGQSFSGRIQAISPVADSQTRLFRVYAEVPNPEGLLRPGMYATVTYQIKIQR